MDDEGWLLERNLRRNEISELSLSTLYSKEADNRRLDEGTKKPMAAVRTLQLKGWKELKERVELLSLNTSSLSFLSLFSPFFLVSSRVSLLRYMRKEGVFIHLWAWPRILQSRSSDIEEKEYMRNKANAPQWKIEIETNTFPFSVYRPEYPFIHPSFRKPCW